MSIPAFSPHGLLPAGIHDATLDEVQEAFGAKNPRRAELFEKLTKFVDTAKRFGVFTALYVDGSFVTDKELPGDIDGVLELPRVSFRTFLAHTEASSLIDVASVKAAYEVHLFFQPAARSPSEPDMVDFFQHLRPEEALMRRVGPDTMRGILRVVL
jgi:hypothetical protein